VHLVGFYSILSSGQFHFVAIYHRSLLYFLNIILDKPKSGLTGAKKRKNIFTPPEMELRFLRGPACSLGNYMTLEFAIPCIIIYSNKSN
jgi:hypothetical protein